jgi:hypothetical protein
MTRRKTRSKQPERRFFIKGVRRDQPDMQKLGKVLLAVVLAEQQHKFHDPDASESDG